MIYSPKIIILVIVLAWSAVPVSKMQHSSQPGIKVEFRLAETLQANGLTEEAVSGSGHKVYLHKEIVVTNWDILEAHVASQDALGYFDIFITFTEEGANKMAK